MYPFHITASLSCDFHQIYAIHQTLQVLTVSNVEATVRVALSVRTLSSRCLTSQERKWQGRGEGRRKRRRREEMVYISTVA
jgi:hypothetical protein